MTEAKIIKALECFAIDKDSDELYCVGCAFETKGLCCENCSDALVKASLDLINRQKAEIERLQKEYNQFADIGKMYSEIKVDTIKKYKHTIRTLFRLKFLRKKPYDEIFDEAETMMLRRIAGEVKEMAGETE